MRKRHDFFHLLCHVIMDVITLCYKICKPLEVYQFYCMTLYHSQMRRHVIKTVFFHLTGSDQSPSTAAPSTSESAYFQSPPRPVSLSLDHTSDSSYPQVVNTNTSNHAALDYLLPNSGTCLSGAQTEKSNSGTFLSGAETEKANSGTCLSGAETEKSNSGTFLSGAETEKAPPFTEIKTKMTLAETVDILRQAPNLNGVSVLKNNSLHKKSSLTPSDDRSSRNSSRSVTPNVTPIKSEVLTPSCTPCSTPKKSPSCSPAPSLDHVAVAQVKRKQKYLFRLHQEVLAQWMDGLYYLGTILKVRTLSILKMVVIRAGIYKMLVRTPKREEPNQTASKSICSRSQAKVKWKI